MLFNLHAKFLPYSLAHIKNIERKENKLLLLKWYLQPCRVDFENLSLDDSPP